MWFKDEERYNSRQTLMVYTNINIYAERYEHKAKVLIRCSSWDCNFDDIHRPPTYCQNDSEIMEDNSHHITVAFIQLRLTSTEGPEEGHISTKISRL
jgi:hypothetical protein